MNELARPNPALTRRDYIDAAEAICKAHRITLDTLCKHDRRPVRVAVRRAVALKLREMGASFPEIGSVLERDHTTAMYLVRTEMAREKNARKKVEWIFRMRVVA